MADSRQLLVSCRGEIGTVCSRHLGVHWWRLLRVPHLILLPHPVHSWRTASRASPHLVMPGGSGASRPVRRRRARPRRAAVRAARWSCAARSCRRCAAPGATAGRGRPRRGSGRPAGPGPAARRAATSPSANAGSRSWIRVCSPTVYGPNVAPISAPVPDSAAASQRPAPNAPSLVAFDGRPNYSAFSAVAGTSVLEPSTDTTRSPQQNTPAARWTPTGAGDLLEEHVQRISAQPGPHPRQRGDVRPPPPPPALAWAFHRGDGLVS